MKTALKLTVASELDENYLIEQELDQVKRLLDVGGLVANVRHGEIKEERAG